MTKETKRLTDEQREFAAKNCGLIHWYLHSMQLPEDEFYGMMAIGFLKAVVKYTERPEVRKYAFSTIAKRAMMSELGEYVRSQKTQKRNADVVSVENYDCVAPMGHIQSYSHHDLSDILVRRENIRDFIESLWQPFCDQCSMA